MPYIIHIDDNEIDRSLLSRSLKIKRKDLEINSLGSVDSAITYLNSISKPDIRVPDLIITDNNMPVKSGFEFVKFIKSTEKFNKIPIVMLSSSTLDKDIQKAYILGVDSYFSKPITSAAVTHIFDILKAD